MNDHVDSFNRKLKEIFESKAREFTKFSQESPSEAKAAVTSQLAGLYEDLARVMQG